MFDSHTFFHEILHQGRSFPRERWPRATLFPVNKFRVYRNSEALASEHKAQARGRFSVKIASLTTRSGMESQLKTLAVAGLPHRGGCLK